MRSSLMNHPVALDEAKTIAALLPTLVRQLFADEDDLAAELPLAQLRVCSVLYNGPRSMSALGRELRVSLSATTQIADRLEQAGLVERLAMGQDRRVRRLQLTERGEKMMRLREKARTHRVSMALEHLAPKTRAEVLAALQTFTQACAAAHGQNGNGDEAEPQLVTSKATL